MSTHESYSTLVNSRAPRSTLGAQRIFKTFSSAALERDDNLPPLTVPPWSANLATSRGPFIQAMIDVAAIGAAMLLITVTSLSIVLSLFILLFVEL